MLKGFKIQLNPNKSQEVLLNKHVGSCRFVYNYFLDLRKQHYDFDGTRISTNDCLRELTILKKTDKCKWLQEINTPSLQQVLRDQDQAYKNFFKGRSQFPKFKSKHKDRPSFRMTNTNDSVRFQNQTLKVGKIGFIRITRADKQLKRLPKKFIIKSATVSKDSDQHWYASVLLECENQTHLPGLDNIVGIDLGISNNYKLCYLNQNDELDYTTIDNPRAFEKKHKRLARLQRRVSRKVKGSKNREKAKVLVSKQHFKIKSIRKDFNHKLSKNLIDNFQVIVIEDLDLAKMKENRLGRSISDLAFYQFRTFLTYKSEWYGRNLVVAESYFASTKVCAECGHKNMNLTLKDRRYTCPSCKTNLDRDENAAKNLYQLGICYCNTGNILDTNNYIQILQQ